MADTKNRTEGLEFRQKSKPYAFDTCAVVWRGAKVIYVIVPEGYGYGCERGHGVQLMTLAEFEKKYEWAEGGDPTTVFSRLLQQEEDNKATRSK